MTIARVGFMALCASVGCAATCDAQSQGVGDDFFRRDRNVSVRERPKPEYDISGMYMGGFRFFPEVSAGIGYTDNLYATSSNKQSDSFWNLEGAGRLQSQWSSHALALNAGVQSKIYSDVTDENTTDWTLGADGRLDIVRGMFATVSASYADRHEPRADSDFAAALVEPVEYEQAAAALGLERTFNRLRLGVSGAYDKFDFKNGRTAANAIVIEDDRDREVFTAGGRADYAISPDTSIFVSATANWRDYRLEPPATGVFVQRDSDGYEALIGANFDFTHLVRGEAAIGYLSQNFDDPALDSQSGLAVRGKIEYFPDPLVTVTLNAAREIGDAGVIGASSYVSNAVGLGVDYEFRRNIVIGLGASYDRDEYDGIDRDDDRLNTLARADYAVNRMAALFVQYDFQKQDSSGSSAGRDYDVNRVMVGLRLRR